MASTSAKYLSMTVGGSVVRGLTEWTVRETGDALDATDANSLGREQIDVGIINPEVRASGYHKLTTGPFPTLRVGSILTSVRCFANINVAAATWEFERLVVVECEHPVQVRGQIRFSFVARNTETLSGDTAASWTGPTA